MASNHKKAIDLALRANDDLKRLFDRAGNADNSRGKILVAYRTARLALAKQLRDHDSFGAVRTMGDLRAMVLDSTGDLLKSAADQGAAQAKKQLDLYNIPPSQNQNAQAGLIQNSTAAVALEISKQEIALRAALAQGDYNIAPMLGDGSARMGAIAPAPILLSLAYWIGTTALGSYLESIKNPVGGEHRRAGDEIFRRQAIAAIDERTTDCCLQVTGQIVKMDQEFILTGTPRYADHKMNPPFHWYCRTATALIHIEDVGDSWTKEIRDAARAELSARATQKDRKEIHPAHSTSRRN